jgi:hypothetical protein
MNRGCAALFVSLGLVGCKSPAKAPDAIDMSVRLQQFVAQSSDFAGFRSWPSHSIEGPPPDGSPHTTDLRTVYLNEAPPHGATAFPVGTIIVKTIHDSVTVGDLSLDQTFAMAKRGGNYNTGGATGWEWFELDVTVAPPGIIWRGQQPPAGIVYSTLGAVDCNGCHAVAAANDYVRDPDIQLADF